MASQVRSVDNVLSSQWANPADAFTENDLCTSTAGGENQNVYNIINTPFTIPAGAIIEGIEVQVIRGGDADDHYTIELQDKIPIWKLKTGTAYLATCAEGMPEILGTPIDDWGGLWDAIHINSSNFQIRLTYLKIAKPNTFNVDCVEVTIYYTAFAPSVGLTVALVCHSRVLAANTNNLLYHSRNLIGYANALQYNIRGLVSSMKSLVYHLGSLAGKMGSSVYHVRESIGNTEMLIYNVYGIMTAGLTHTFVYHIRNLTGKTDALKYHTRDLAGRTRSFIYKVRNRAGKTKTFRNHIRVLAGINHTLIYHVAIVRIVACVVELQFAAKEQILSFANKVTNLKFGEKEV